MNNLQMSSIIDTYSRPQSTGNPLRPQDIDVKPAMPPVPKGCTRYWFDELGCTLRGTGKVYFDALTKANAVKKWQRWLKLKHHE
jgi:hypothetical protein